MPDQVTCSIAVVCEADTDRRAATLLSDRVLRETIEWISPETPAWAISRGVLGYLVAHGRAAHEEGDPGQRAVRSALRRRGRTGDAARQLACRLVQGFSGAGAPVEAALTA